MKIEKIILIILVALYIVIFKNAFASEGHSSETAPDKIDKVVHKSNDQNLVGPSNPLPKNPTTINDYIEYALANNPAIRSAQQKWLAATKIPGQVSTLPDPQLMYTYFIEEVQTRLGPQENKLMLSQKFPTFGKLSLRGQIASKDALIARQKYEAIKREIIAQVKNAYYELYWVNQAIEITEENKILLEGLEKDARADFETGKAPEQNVIKLQVELSKIEEDLITLKEKKETVIAKFNTLLNRLPEAELETPADFEISELKINLDELYKMAKRYRQELKAAGLTIEKNEAALKLAKRQYYPDIMLSLNYIEIGSGTTTMLNDGTDAWMASIGINIPLWRKKLALSVQQAKANLKASEHAYRDVENMTLFEVKNLHFKMDTALRLARLYSTTLIHQAEQSFRAAKAGYETGKVDFLNLIDSERILLAFNLAYYRAKADYQQTLAALERAIGKDLEK